MDLIKECFDDHRSAFSEILEVAGFSIDQVDKFLPEAALGIVEATQKTSVFQTFAALLSDHPSKLLITIEIDAIVKKTGVNSAQVTLGLHAIAPVLLQTYSQKKQDIDTVVPSVSRMQYVM